MKPEKMMGNGMREGKCQTGRRKTDDCQKFDESVDALERVMERRLERQNLLRPEYGPGQLTGWSGSEGRLS